MRKFPKTGLKEFRIFKKLNSPRKIQDFLNKLPMNFEPDGDTCRSPLMALREGEAHCMEGALLAAAALWHHGEKPLLLDLRTAKGDDYHVVTLFRRPRRSGRGGYWGALSKTNHPVLRYRDPVYKTVRELAVSFFNEYFLNDGRKTLRSYSAPFSLLRYGDSWLTSEKDLSRISADLDRARHFKLVENAAVRNLRRADPLEIKATKFTEWKER